jgi:hypothetical protein
MRTQCKHIGNRKKTKKPNTPPSAPIRKKLGLLGACHIASLVEIISIPTYFVTIFNLGYTGRYIQIEGLINKIELLLTNEMLRLEFSFSNMIA